MAENTFDAILIGAGIRTLPQHKLLFERIINAVHQNAPAANSSYTLRYNRSDYTRTMRLSFEKEYKLMSAIVVAVHRSATHTFSKPNQASIQLVAGLGVKGDAHMGATVKHRSRVAIDPTQPNLRQIHLIHAELHDELNIAGFNVLAGEIGENITTRGIAVLELPTGARLHIGDVAVVEVTGLRNPCAQLDQFQPGLQAAVLGRDAHGNRIRKAGIMGIVLSSGIVNIGDHIRIEMPQQPYRPLECV